MCRQTRPEKSVQLEPNNKPAGRWPRKYSPCLRPPTPIPPVVHLVSMTGKRPMQDPSQKQVPAYPLPETSFVPSLQRAYRSLILLSPSCTRKYPLRQNAEAGQSVHSPMQWSSYLSNLGRAGHAKRVQLAPIGASEVSPNTLSPSYEFDVCTRICRHLLVTRIGELKLGDFLKLPVKSKCCSKRAVCHSKAANSAASNCKDSNIFRYLCKEPENLNQL